MLFSAHRRATTRRPNHRLHSCNSQGHLVLQTRPVNRIRPPKLPKTITKLVQFKIVKWVQIERVKSLKSYKPTRKGKSQVDRLQRIQQGVRRRAVSQNRKVLRLSRRSEDVALRYLSYRQALEAQQRRSPPWSLRLSIPTIWWRAHSLRLLQHHQFWVAHLIFKIRLQARMK